MKPVVFRSLVTMLIVCAVGVLPACSSYSANVKPASDLSKYQHIWVKSNMDDNHALGQFLSNALAARGIDTGLGPLTMMPLGMQAVLSYRDSWTWDFKSHMTGLEITLQDNKIDFPIATANYVGPTALTAEPSEVAAKLVKKLFATLPDKAKE